MLNLQIIIGSVRQGRGGLSVAEWFEDIARKDTRFTVERVDLAELNLPIMDEPNHPRLQRYTHDHTKRFSEIITRGDAYVFVTTEYNYAIPGALKNALDYLGPEWAGKPMCAVAYGGVSGAARAVEDLRRVAVALKMIPLVQGVVCPLYAQQRDDEGRFHGNQTQTEAAAETLNILAEMGAVLKARRLAAA
ncbi:NAD(P)H-dependent oxidoreductase [Paracoccus sp. 11-3]|uniref:NAD(P)H-dependent oxidoreductase n=1 Tax=Paracoccus amoyensis TaxID=2760093 RepID=A0A926GP81_9RHOB|nr:NAD(P)H-dependent oxidoreductase [Paracoccus amoyensis]MBC9247460.1 NAD(P)H-dependent oxidoreductase [Paracoccus amoyensis]